MTMYHDRQRNLLLYDGYAAASGTVTQHVSQAIQINPGLVAVPINLNNLQLCRWLGLPVIPVMNYDYDWPHGPQIEVPFKAQIVTSNFLVTHPRAFVLSDMRTGKTLALLWAAERVIREYPPGQCRVIIACPLSIVQDVWGNNIWQHFMGRRTYGILHGSAQQRIDVLNEPHDFYIINHDGVGVGARMGKKKNEVILDGFSKQLAERDDIKIAIIDETGAYRTGNTRRHRVARLVLATRPYFWGATGTPTPNGPQDAHGQARLVNGAFGESYTSYRARVMISMGKFRWFPRKGSHAEALKLLSPAVRFRTEDCTDVPAKLPPQCINVGLNDAQKAAYKELRGTAMLMVEGGVITADNEAALRTKLIQVSCGVVYRGTGNERTTHEIGCHARIAAMYDVIEQAGRKIIIMAPLTSVLTMLHKELTKDITIEGVKQQQYKAAIINGKVTPKRRAEILTEFRDPEGLDILLADPGTLQHGIDLSNSKVLLWFALPDKTEHYLQANERIRGPRQKWPTLVAHLVATSVEREIFRRLSENESLQGAMLALVKGDTDGNYGRGFGAAPPGFAHAY
jgi:Helicase conserved C-terminal domain/SNF2-related domain